SNALQKSVTWFSCTALALPHRPCRQPTAQHGRAEDQSQRTQTENAPRRQHELFDVSQVEREAQASYRSDEQHKWGLGFVAVNRRQTENQEIAKDSDQRHRNSQDDRIRAAVHEVAVERRAKVA